MKPKIVVVLSWGEVEAELDSDLFSAGLLSQAQGLLHGRFRERLKHVARGRDQRRRRRRGAGHERNIVHDQPVR